MPAYQGTYYSRSFQMMSVTTGKPIDITGWTFQAEVRVNLTDAAPQLTLTSAAAGFTILDAPNGRFSMNITATQTLALPLGGVIFDVLRTDPTNGPVWLFGGRFKVKQPVTR